MLPASIMVAPNSPKALANDTAAAASNPGAASGSVIVKKTRSGPAFSEDGKLVGFVVRQPDKDGGGSAFSQSAMLASFILPVDQLAKATMQVHSTDEDKRPAASGGS